MGLVGADETYMSGERDKQEAWSRLAFNRDHFGMVAVPINGELPLNLAETVHLDLPAAQDM